MPPVRDAFSSIAAGLGTLNGSVYDRTLSHTNGAGVPTDGSLFVFAWSDSVNDVVTAITYNGVAAAEIQRLNLLKWLYVARFPLAAAGAHNIVVTTSTQPNVAIAARSYTAAAQGNVASSTRAGGASGVTVFTMSVDTVVDNSIACLFAANDFGPPSGVGAGNTAVDLSKQRAAITEITGTVAVAGTQVYPQFTIGTPATWEGVGFAIGPYIAPPAAPPGSWPNTTRDIVTKPTLPALGPAGFLFTDPAFFSRMGRVTDGNCTAAIEPGYLNGSYRTASGSQQPIWNADSTKFVLQRTDGSSWLFTFNPDAMTWAVRERLLINGDSAWSRTNPNHLYARGMSTNLLVRADVSTTPATITTVVDAEVLIPAIAGQGTYMQNVFTAYNNVVMFTTGGTIGDYTHYVVWYPLDNPSGVKILDTRTRVEVWKTYGIGPYIHSAQPDLSGRYVMFQPSGFQLRSDKFWIWDTTTNVITEMTVAPDGHGAPGYGWYVNGDVFNGTWDAAQRTYRDLAFPNGPGMRVLIDPVLTPTEVYLGEHGNLNNVNPTSGKLPYVSAPYRYYDGPYNIDPKNLSPWRAWDDEVIMIPTDGLGGPVQRFCHHRSRVWPEPPQTRLFSFEFWPLPRANISPNGRWVLFTSNWEHTLGFDPYETRGISEAIKGTTHREDVFIVETGRVATGELAVRSSSVATNLAGGTAVSIAAPAGVGVGDLVVVVVSANGQTQTITDNNGATPFAKDLADLTQVSMTVSIFMRRIQAGDPSTYNFTIGTSQRWTAVAVAYQSPNPLTVYDVIAAYNLNGNAGVATVDAPSITTLTPNALHSVVCCVDGITQPITGTPAGYAVQQNGGDQAVAFATKAIGTPGLTGAQTFTHAAQTSIGISFAIKPTVSGVSARWSEHVTRGVNRGVFG